MSHEYYIPDSFNGPNGLQYQCAGMVTIYQGNFSISKLHFIIYIHNAVLCHIKKPNRLGFTQNFRCIIFALDVEFH